MTIKAHKWDEHQKAVIHADTHERLIVDAGPGTGKTAVACARLAAIIQESEISVSRILMLSFTRTAVAEIRARLYSYIGEEAFSVKLATIDSHAWTIHSGFDPKARLTGSYESNIFTVLQLVKEDEDVADYLEGLEHIVIDEAQDLVGIRGQLVEAIVDRVQPDCGITIFADEAQAIYGFSEDSTAAEATEDLLTRLRSNSRIKFESKKLQTIYRTKSPGLHNIFNDVRNTLLKRMEKPENLFSDMTKLVETHAHEKGIKATDLNLDKLDSDSLVLFRSRAEALQTSQFFELPHRLRLSGFGATLPAWLGACFFDFEQPILDERGFFDLWQDRIEGQCYSSDSPGEAWEKLLSLANQGDDSISMKRLRGQLSRSRPPLEIASTEFGLPGPIIGTIHASKGREADHVTLLIPQRNSDKDTALEAEESRILFVGATRAKNYLRVGKAMKYSGSSIRSGRAYRKVQGHAMIEIGRESDLLADGLVGRSLMPEAQCRLAQKRLVITSGVKTSLVLQQDSEKDWRYLLKDPELSIPLGLMAKSLDQDFWNVGKELTDTKTEKLRPGGTIRNVRASGTRTMVLPEDCPELHLLHHPWAKSGFILAPMIAAFTKVYFSKATNGN